MRYLLNTNVTRKYNYYFSKEINLSPKFYFSKNYVLFLLIAILTCSAIFFAKVFVYDNSIYHFENRGKIHNLVFALDEIYFNKHFSEKELKKLADYIIKNSKTFEIEPELILAIISVESSFDNFAVSNKGALGLMQIMPNTFIETAKELGIENLSDKNIYDVENNIKVGTYYLAKLNKKYNNDIKLSLTAYNRGPSSLDRRLRNNEAVSYKYFHKVMENYKKFIL